jgi:hypothetical protein
MVSFTDPMRTELVGATCAHGAGGRDLCAWVRRIRGGARGPDARKNDPPARA